MNDLSDRILQLEEENALLKKLNDELCDRVAKASAMLTKKAERIVQLPGEGGDPTFKSILKELWQQHLSKSGDYGTDQDPLDNIHSVKEIGIEPWVYAFSCAMEASRRVRNHLNGRKQLSGDKLSNALLDAASWSILSEVERRQSAHVAASLSKGDECQNQPSKHSTT